MTVCLSVGSRDSAGGSHSPQSESNRYESSVRVGGRTRLMPSIAGRGQTDDQADACDSRLRLPTETDDCDSDPDCGLRLPTPDPDCRRSRHRKSTRNCRNQGVRTQRVSVKEDLMSEVNFWTTAGARRKTTTSARRIASSSQRCARPRWRISEERDHGEDRSERSGAPRRARCAGPYAGHHRRPAARADRRDGVGRGRHHAGRRTLIVAFARERGIAEGARPIDCWRTGWLNSPRPRFPLVRRG